MRAVTTILGVWAVTVAAGCAAGGGPAAVRSQPVHLEGGADDSGLYDAWDFYGQSAEQPSIVLEATRDDGALGRIDATPLDDGSLRLTASVGTEHAELELGSDGTLVAMYSDGDDVSHLLVEAASDLSARGAELTWNGDGALDAERTAAPAGGSEVAGAEEALTAPKFVVAVECLWAASTSTSATGRRRCRAT